MNERDLWVRINFDLIALRESLRAAHAPDEVIQAVQTTHRQLLHADELRYRNQQRAALAATEPPSEPSAERGLAS